MKKSLYLWGILFGIIGILGIAGVKTIADAQDQVVITQKTLEGDILAAEGITFQIRNEWSGRIGWKTTATVDNKVPGGLVTDTRVTKMWESSTRSLFPAYFADRDVIELSFSADAYRIYYASGGEAWYEEAVSAVADRTGMGETHTEVIKWKDYCEFFPLIEEYDIDYLYVNLDEQPHSISEMLQIQIPDTYEVEISVTRNDEGEVIQIRDLYDQRISIQSEAVRVDDGIYFTVSARQEDEMGKVTVLQSALGNGIYYLPLVPTRDSLVAMDFANMKKVYSFSDEVCVEELVLDEERKYLLVFAVEAEEMRLYTMDRKDMAIKSEITLFPCKEVQSDPVIENIGGNLLLLRNSGDVAFLTKEEPGVYTGFMTYNLGAEVMLPNSYGWQYAVDYQEGRLALICCESSWACSTYVYVFDQTGLLYKGYYRHSADDEDEDSPWDIEMIEENALSIRWHK